MADPRSHFGRIAIILMIAGAAAGAGGEDLVTGQLVIRGAVLSVSPEHQEVAPGLPTVVQTTLGQLEAGQIPAGLRVEGDLSGPGLDEPLRLTTTPGDAFRIPGLNREGTYILSGIRLVEGGRIISAADPDSVEILVHRLVISSITSRALTPEEMDAYGIVIDADNYTAWHYSVGFQIEGGTVEVPFNLMLGPQGMTLLDSPDAYALPVPNPNFPEVPVPTVNTGALEPIPRVAQELEAGDLEVLGSTPIPGFIIIPSDIAFLNQFFSVIMVVQNGALAGSGLELRDLTGVLELSGDGIRQAETDPPTIPGEPVPVLDPGPDGETGTSDDLTFIVAQASGQATWLVEGLREGHHRLTAHLTGEIHGLASGNPAAVEGKIPGVVVVRDPRFAMTFFHPNTVRTGEFYDFRVSVTNISTTPVYDLSLELPLDPNSSVRLVAADDDEYDEIEEGDNAAVQEVAELLPGATGMVTWRLESRRTGRVVASAFNTSSPLDASFVFEMGVGELGIPLSPETIVLPRVVDDLPVAVVEPALELLGLAHSLANAPNGVEVDLPPVGETIVMLRGTELAAAGQRHAFGEPVARSVVGFGLEWMGASHWSSSFDVLRRQSRRGHELENATAFYLGERMGEIGAEEALAEVEELAISGRPMALVFAEGAGFDGDARLALVGNTSGRSAIGQRADVEFFSRELEGAAILSVDSDAWSGEIGVIAVPIEEGSWFEESYQIQLWGVASGQVNLEVVLVMPDGGTRRFVPSVAVETGGRSLAFINVGPEMETTSIRSDTNGDSNQDWSESIGVVVRGAPAARIITADFNDTINPARGGPYRNVVVLVSQPVDGDALATIEAADWFVESELEIGTEDGGSESFARDRHGRSFRLQLDPRILIATFEEPLNPHAELRLSSGSSPLPLVGGGELTIIDKAISTGGGLESGVVRGVVLGPDGGPLAHAIVELYELIEICSAIDGCNCYPSLSDRVGADAAGGFLFDAVRYRDETIPSLQAAFTVRAVDPSTGHEARLVARLPGDNQTRSLTLAMVGRGDVVGTLRKADGSPLEDPLVIARSITNPTEGAQSVPDASGNFRLEDLPVGPVQVVAKDGQAYTYATAQITAPGAEAVVELVLQEFNQPLAQVDGSVIDGETAEPAGGLEVFVIPAGFSGPTHVATTDGDGAFSMSDVPPGVARFKAWSPTLGRYVGEVVFDLMGDSNNRVEMVLRPGATGTIVGTVTLASPGSETPVAGAYVVARDQGVFTLTDDEGHYELTNLPLGTIRLETWDPVTAAATNREVDLIADGQVLVIDFVLREDHGLGSVRINVADRNGVPEVGAEVALGWLGSSYRGYTIGDGSVLIEEVPPGTHDVLIKLGGRLARGKVKVLYPGHAAQASIVLGGLRNATIRVIGDTTGDGSSVPLTPIGYRVPGVRSNGTIGQLPEEGWTDCELEDDHSCRVRNLPTNVGSLVAVASSGFYGPVTASKWIDDGGDHELIINFEALGVVGGRIVRTGPDGVEPVEGAVVELWIRVTTGLIPQSQVTTREDGAFQFDLVPLGEYSLRAYHENHGVQWLNGRVSAGQVIDDLELRLRGRASIEGEVALCFDTKSLKAGSQVRVSLWPNGVPRPFISDLDEEIEDFNRGVLDLTLDEDERATFSFNNRMVGVWTLSATSALHGSAYEPVSLGPPEETSTLAEPLCLHPTGSVTGRVAFPETGDPAPSVTVQLFRKVSYYFEYLTTETTGEDGSFSFPDVPVGREYQVRAFDTASNRGGVSATARLCDASDSGYGTTCDLDAVLDISLSPMGRIEGVLRDQDELPVANAHVRLQTSVVLNQNGTVQSYQREWTTFSAADGGFFFDGVPAGTAQITAFDPDSPLFVERSISLDPVGSPTVVADLQLPPIAEVAVRVVDPLGADVEDGDQVVVFRQSSQTKFREPSGSSPRVEHVAHGAAPSFAGVVADRYKVGACIGGCSSFGVEQVLAHQFNSALGAVAERWMSNPPSDQVVELELAGRAAVAVTVNQAGAPVAEAVVRITGGGFYGTRDVTTQTGVDGAITPILGLGIGNYSVIASWEQIGGSREVEITQADHGSTIELTIGIEESTSAAGHVLDPEGQPAEGALIKMNFGGRTFQTISDGDGAFVFSVLPTHQVYRLDAYAANGLGRHTLHNIEVTAEPVDLGELVLDEINPWVNGVSPANGAQNAETDLDIVIDFSERMRWATLTGDRIKLREHGSGTLVSTARTIEDQPDPDAEGPLAPFTRLILSHSALDSEKLYLVDILKTVEDMAGRSPSFDFHSTFRTRDTVPPEVVGVSPANDPNGLTPVGPDAVPIISFSESMDSDSANASTVLLFDSDDQLLETVIDLQRDGFDIRIRPTTALELDAFYTIVIDGVTDAAGLPLPAPYASTFRVRDIEAPVVTLLPPEGVTVEGETWTALEGREIMLLAAASSNDALRLVVFTVNEIPIVAAPGQTAGAYQATVGLPVGLASVIITVTAEDVSGNLSNVASHAIVLVDDESPVGTLNITPAEGILPNHILSITAEAQDDHGLRFAHISVSGSAIGHWSIPINGISDDATATLRIPVDAEAGGQVVVECEIEDSVGQRSQLPPQSVTLVADSVEPSIEVVVPTVGASYQSGEEVAFEFSLEDEVEVSSVSLSLDGQELAVVLYQNHLPGETWGGRATAEWSVPEFFEPTDLDWLFTATDRAGNTETAEGLITVSPSTMEGAPLVTVLCPTSGDYCAPDVTMSVSFELSDEDAIQHYSVWVDGVSLIDSEPVDDVDFAGEFQWTPPANALGGDQFVVRIEARDMAGNVGFKSVTLKVPEATPLFGEQALTAAMVDGQSVALVGGVFTAVEPLNPETLILIQGASLVGEQGEALELNATNLVHVGCGAAVDVTGLGYLGGTGSHPDGFAPPWVEASKPESGGSHGGTGSIGEEGGIPGETYDSIYQPQIGGGGGSYGLNDVGGPGGGVLVVEADDLVINGVVEALGDDWNDWGGPTGAGGSISVTARRLAGAGRIDASGGDSEYSEGTGGGGRIALTVDGFDNFNPVEQVFAGSGIYFNYYGYRYASTGSSGTVFIREPGSINGSLLIVSPLPDTRPIQDPAERPAPTKLPRLGEGQVVAFAAAGPDAWVEAAEPFRPRWLGAWMTLLDASGSEIGFYLVVEIDEAGSARLEGAGTAVVAASFRGEYRFDRVDVLPGASLEIAGPLWTAHLKLWDGADVVALGSVEVEQLEVEGSAGVTGDLVVTDATVPEGATLRSVAGRSLRLHVTNNLTIAAGGAIDVTGQGYAGDDRWHSAAEAPIDVQAASDRTAGSHGGRGSSSVDVYGETFGSLFKPRLGGGGAGANGGREGAPGGGVVELSVGTLTLEGSLRADGGAPLSSSANSGAGGSILLAAGVLTGSGEINAVGGSYTYSNGGGGGRIALYVNEFVEFDPLAQVTANGGVRLTSENEPIYEYGGHGTVFVYGPDSTFGDLSIGRGDCGGIPVELTPLPGIGRHAAGVVEPDSENPSDVWIEPADPGARFGLGVVGLWARVNGGDFRVIRQENRRRILLQNAAASIEAGDAFEGVAKLDTITVGACANVVFGDITEYQDLVVDPESTIHEVNSGPPKIDPDLIRIAASDGRFLISGDLDAVTDDDGISEVYFRLVSTGSERRMTWNDNGSLEPFAISGVNPGEEWAIDAYDAHPLPLDASEGFVFPANGGPPDVYDGQMEFGVNEYGIYYLQGFSGAVADPDQRIWVEVVVASTGSVLGGAYAGEDGAFGVYMGTEPPHGESVNVEATDGHPDPQTTVRGLGVIPDLAPPRIDSSRVSIGFFDRSFFVSGSAGTVTDDVALDHAELVDASLYETPISVAGDGSFGQVAVNAPSGTELTLRAVDTSGNEGTALLDPLPANDGPPILRTEHVSLTTLGGTYSIESSGFCNWIDDKSTKDVVICDYPIESHDGIVSPRFENKTTPGFGPFEFAPNVECTDCYSFDPVLIDGAVGDQIWLVVEDGHPDWQVAEALIWYLPPIPGAPLVELDEDRLALMDGTYILSVFENDITDPDAPLTIDTVVWRDIEGSWDQVFTDSRSMASGEALQVALVGAEPGDLVLASVTDGTGLKTTVRVGYLPPPQSLTVELEDQDPVIPEDAGIIGIKVFLSRVPTTEVTVRWRTVAGSAEADVDYGHEEGEIVFPAGADHEEWIDIEILNDSDPEGDESFRVELFDPIGAELGPSDNVELTIVDDDDDLDAIPVIPFSVEVGAPNHLDAPVDVSIVNGMASFAQPLPAVVGRGDRLEVEGLGSVFIDRCANDSTCRVIDGRGQPPMDAYGVQVTVATAAFGSLAEAVTGAADADHLDTFDLVAANRVLEFVCYGDYEDTTPVVIDNWVTSEDNRIRIVVAEASYGHDANWRHPGRWSGGDYRIEVDGTDCIWTTVGNLTIEGLQLGCGAGPTVGVAGIRVVETTGKLELTESLIMLDGTSGTAQRAGIAISSSEALEVDIRNSILWDLGDPGNEFQAGILVDGSEVNLWAANNTIVGGGYGIHNLDGTVMAINNLVAESRLASYEGEFELPSTMNLGSGANVPGPPAHAVGPLTVVNPVPSHDADFHLRCGVLDQAVTISHDFEVGSEEDLVVVFDGDSDTLLRSAAINPARVMLDFGGERAVTGTSVVLSHHDSHKWMVAAADSVADLNAKTGSYRVLVPWREVENTHIVWDGVSFDTPESFEVIELLVERVGGDDYVHIAEWSLESLNPACGQGVDLSEAGDNKFVRDVDSVARFGAWDIGADQEQELEVGFAEGPNEWWEDEASAQIQVVLSEPAPAEVRVRYRTESHTAVPVDDYEEKTGELVFAPGQFSKIIRIDLNQDGPNGDDSKFFAVLLHDAVGARLENWWRETVIREGTPPVRVRLVDVIIDVNEADGVAVIPVEMTDEAETDVWGSWDATDSTAHIGADYIGAPWANYSFPPGETHDNLHFDLVDDDVVEGIEGFLIKPGWPDGAEPGVPSVGYVRITDDDGGSP